MLNEDLPPKKKKRRAEMSDELPIVEARAWAPVATPMLQPTDDKSKSRESPFVWLVLAALVVFGIAGAIWGLLR